MSAENLRSFFADPLNTVTRERIFFNRLSFDLKIAAARVGYHLHLYEPDVDRDGFDFVAEDDDGGVGWYQTKAVLSSAGTAAWEISVDFLRPSVAYSDAYDFAPVEAGRGGGVILIEIADGTTAGAVTYRYTDFDIIAAIANGFLVERAYSGRGRPAKPARDEGNDLVRDIRASPRDRVISLPKKLFVTVSSPDALLSLMGMRNEGGYGTYAIRNSYGIVSIDQIGKSHADAPVAETAALHHQMNLLCAAQPASRTGRKTTLFTPFDWVRPADPRS